MSNCARGAIDIPAAITEHVWGYIDAGINSVISNIPQVAYGRKRLHRFAEEVIPHVS